jgi:hypothetical protein
MAAPLMVNPRAGLSLPVRPSPALRHLVLEHPLTPHEIVILTGALTHASSLVTIDLHEALPGTLIDLLPTTLLNHLATAVPALTTLNLSGTVLRLDSLRGAQTIRVRSEKGLRRQDVAVISGVARLGDALAVDLEGTQLGRSVRFLEPCLGRGSRLTRLYLAQNNIAGDDCVELVRMLETNTALRLLDLRVNRIGDLGGEALGGLLAKTGTLSSLEVSQNELGNRGALALAEGIAANRAISASLTSISLIGNKFTDVGARALEDALHTPGARTKLTMRLNLSGAVLTSTAAYDGESEFDGKGEPKVHYWNGQVDPLGPKP